MEDTNTHNKEEGLTGKVLTGVWNFFTSLKLTVILLILLATVSIIGTVIDQTDPGKNLQMLSDLFGPGRAKGALDWLVKLGLTDMYHSWWFVGLLSTLSANITICSLERFPRVWHMVTRKQGPLTEDVLKTLGNKHVMKVNPSGFTEKAKAAMKSAGLNPKEEAVGDEVHLYAESGKFSRLGVYITHASVLVIFIGAIIGSFWGYKGYVQIIENGSVDEVSLMSKPLLKDYPGNVVKLGFRVRCDKFELATHKQAQFRGMPSDYLSTLTVLEGDKVILTKLIQVNDPLQYQGIRFYQSSYGQLPGMATMTIRASTTGGSFSVRDYKLRKGERVKLEGSPYYITITEMAADVAFGPGGQLVAQSDQFKGSGAAVIEFSDEQGRPVEKAVIANIDPRSQPQRIPFRFSIVDYRGPYYTGLQVSYDPGVWIVWTGCILMVGGILVAFFLFHKRVWIRIAPAGGGRAEVTVAGSVNKNRHAFEREFKKMVEKIAP